jgi:hypothetical protein
MIFSEEEIRNLAAVIAPTVYDAKCPFCLALPKKRCREQKGPREFGDREQPHRERINAAMAAFLRDSAKKKLALKEGGGS